MTDDRAERAAEDVVAVETVAPGLLRVVTWGDAYVVDARGDGCNCPDKRYHEPPRCKHELGALLADVDTLPSPAVVTDSLDSRPVAADGGERPDDCYCAGEALCFSCHMAGFESANDQLEA